MTNRDKFDNLNHRIRLITHHSRILYSKKGIRKDLEIIIECVCVCVYGIKKNLVYRVPLNCPRWDKNCKVDGIVTGDSFLSRVK